MHELCEWERGGVPAALFEEAAPYLDEIKEPCLVHADLWPGNILNRTDTAVPQFAAVIDADRARYVPLRLKPSESVLRKRTYGAQRTEEPKWRARTGFPVGVAKRL